MSDKNAGARVSVVDRRRFGRRETFKAARIVVPVLPPVRCFVVNLSTGGALLQLKEDEVVRDEFKLIIEDDDIIVSCAVVHRSDARIGVRFTSSPRRASRLGTVSQERAASTVGAIFGQRR